MKNKVVFILANGHSGSTMLDMILGSNKECVSLGEYRTIDTPNLTAKKKKHVGTNLCKVCFGECPVWKVLAVQLKSPHYHDQAHDYFDEPVLIDSSKIAAWPKLMEKYISGEVVYVRLVRNLFSRLGSFKKKHGAITASSITNWMRYEKHITRFLNNRKHIIVRYEDLCQRKDLKILCDHIGIVYDENMWDFWKTRHHNLRGNLKTATLVRIYHGLQKVGDLTPELSSFIKDVGFNIKFVDNFDYLSVADIEKTKSLGAIKINKSLGY